MKRTSIKKFRVPGKNACSFSRNVALVLLGGALIFSILSGDKIPRTGAQTLPPLNLVSEIPDVNGFGFNPKWAWQLTNVGVPDPNQLCFSNGVFGGCTTDPIEFDEPRLPNSATCAFGEGTSIKGHINWGPATFTGRIDWGEFALDGDYCFELTPANNNGLTTHRKTLHVEFDAGETVKYFNTPWWKEFRNKVGIRIGGAGDEEKKFVKEFVNGRRAIVIGRLGLDCVHGCYTELHPVYALAINIKTKVNADKGTVDEVWAIFVRNWGNQGWCSQKQHYLHLEPNSNRISLLLPWGPDTTSTSDNLSYAMVEDGTKFLSNSAQATGPEVTTGGNQGVLVSFNLPKAKDKARIHGELHLRWSYPKPLAAQPATTVSTAASALASSVELQKGEVEERLLSESLGEEGRKRIAAEGEAEKPDSVPQKAIERVESRPRRGLFSIFDKSTRRLIIQPAPPARPPQVESEFDAEKAERDKRLLNAPQNKPR